jgi:hypothetical protein
MLQPESLGYEMKRHKLWFVDKYSKLFDQRKQAKQQWLQHPSQTNGDNMKSPRLETCRTLKNKRRDYLKYKKRA